MEFVAADGELEGGFCVGSGGSDSGGVVRGGY